MNYKTIIMVTSYFLHLFINTLYFVKKNIVWSVYSVERQFRRIYNERMKHGATRYLILREE